MEKSQSGNNSSNSNFKIYSAPVRIFLALFSCYVMTISATLGYIYMLAPFAILIPFCLHTYETITNFMISTWLVLPPILNQVFFGTKLRVFGSPEALDMYAAGVPETGWNLFIMNHRTRLDWYYIWLAFLKSTNAFRMAQMFKIVLKSSLSKIPGYGWSMQMSRFLFLERNWERDKEHLDTYSSMVIDHGAPHSILIFPEGTDYEPNSLLSSHSFARKNNLPAYDYVLHPRITGTVHLMQQLIAGKSLERVVNITAYYPDLIPENELYVLLGKVPKEVWYFVDIIELEDIPGVGDDDSEGKSSEQIGEWLKKLWEEKEELLKTLYEGPSDEKSINDHKHQNGTSEETADNVGVAAKKRTDEAALSSLRDRFVEHNLVSQLSGIHYALFIWWSIFSVLAVYVFSVSLPAQLIALIVVSVTVFVNIKYGGWDYLEMHLHKKRMKEQQKPL